MIHKIFLGLNARCKKKSSVSSPHYGNELNLKTILWAEEKLFRKQFFLLLICNWMQICGSHCFWFCSFIVSFHLTSCYGLFQESAMKAITKGKVIKRGVPPMALFWKKPATPAKSAGKGMCTIH